MRGTQVTRFFKQVSGERKMAECQPLYPQRPHPYPIPNQHSATRRQPRRIPQGQAVEHALVFCYHHHLHVLTATKQQTNRSTAVVVREAAQGETKASTRFWGPFFIFHASRFSSVILQYA